MAPIAAACPLDLAPGERAAFYAAIADRAPDHPAESDVVFERWRLGRLSQEAASAALDATVPPVIHSEADARRVLLAAVVREEHGPERVLHQLEGWEASTFALYERGRARGGCGGYGAYKAIQLPADSPLAPFERQGEALSGWAWGVATWDVAVEGWQIAMGHGDRAVAAELDALAVSILVQLETPAAAPAYFEARCMGDLSCQEERRQAIRGAIRWEGSPWVGF